MIKASNLFVMRNKPEEWKTHQEPQITLFMMDGIAVQVYGGKVNEKCRINNGQSMSCSKSNSRLVIWHHFGASCVCFVYGNLGTIN